MTDLRNLSAYWSETVLSVASDWTPWAVAAAPALVIGHALSKHDQPGFIVVAVALAVELAGVLAGHTLTEAREHNAVRAREAHRRLWPIGAALLAYAAVSMALSVVLDVWPSLVTYWPVLMSPLAVVVYYVYGERLVIRHTRGQTARPVTEPVQVVNRTDRAPVQAVTEPTDSPPAAVQAVTNDEDKDTDGAAESVQPTANGDTKKAALAWLTVHSGSDEDTLAATFNVSPRTARRYLAEWRSLAEPVPAKNGNGNGHKETV